MAGYSNVLKPAGTCFFRGWHACVCVLGGGRGASHLKEALMVGSRATALPLPSLSPGPHTQGGEGRPLLLNWMAPPTHSRTSPMMSIRFPAWTREYETAVATTMTRSVVPESSTAWRWVVGFCVWGCGWLMGWTVHARG